MDTSPALTQEALQSPVRLRLAQWPSLWLRGDPTVLEAPVVAIVGTRSPDVHGLELARWFAWELCQQGLHVISGGALGIDAAVHRAVLSAGQPTAAVLPCGLEALYPRRHEELFRAIVAEGGVLLSPFPPKTPPTHWAFPKRNALLAALCDVLLVVQAPKGSGTLLAAEYARKAGRRVAVVPSSPGDPRGTGNLKLLRSGAAPVSEPRDLLQLLNNPEGPLFSGTRVHTEGRTVGAPRSRKVSGSAKSSRENSPDARSLPTATLQAPAQQWNLDSTARTVYEALAGQVLHLDELLARLSLAPGLLRATLMELVLLDAVREHGDGRYSRPDLR